MKKWIKNVRLEQNFIYDRGNIIGTETGLFALEIENEKIVGIYDEIPTGVDYIDAKGYLALPSLRDNHIHLDKVHFGGPWKAVVPMNGVAARIKEEEEFLLDFLPFLESRGQALLDYVSNSGATFLRVQVNVDPIIGLEHVKIVKKILENNKDKIDYELVAFPQHGTFNTGVELLAGALELGCDLIGGLDPATIDNDIEKSLKVIFDLGKKYNKGIDIHLHDRGTLGNFEIERIIHYTKEYKMQNKVTISHALSLGDSDEITLKEIAKKLVECGIEINTTVPIDTAALNWYKLRRFGVQVNIVNDNINDHWRPYGTGDMIQRASRGAERLGMKDEFLISRALSTVTGGITPLDDEGNVIWPKIGDRADILFANAESSAHLIARILTDRVIMFKGNIVNGKFD